MKCPNETIHMKMHEHTTVLKFLSFLVMLFWKIFSWCLIVYFLFSTWFSIQCPSMEYFGQCSCLFVVRCQLYCLFLFYFSFSVLLHSFLSLHKQKQGGNISTYLLATKMKMIKCISNKVNNFPGKFHKKAKKDS